MQLLEWPMPDDKYLDDELEKRMDTVLSAREVVTTALEAPRAKKVIGHSLGAAITIYASPDWEQVFNGMDQIEKMFIVSSCRVVPVEALPYKAVSLEHVPGLAVEVQPAPGEKCERCWVIDLSVGTHPRHETLCQRCAGVVDSL